MKPHTFRYYVYDRNGNLIFETSSREDAKIWGYYNGSYIVRKDLLGNYKDKTL